jgi:DNA-binding FadR family transcriptional regulator
MVRELFNHWHDTVRHAAHNETILNLLHTLDAQVKSSAPWKVSNAGYSFEQSHAEHDVIVESIRKGNAEIARTQMLDHLAHDRDTRIQQMVSHNLDAPGDLEE